MAAKEGEAGEAKQRPEVTIHNKYVEPHNTRGTRPPGEQKRAKRQNRRRKAGVDPTGRKAQPPSKNPELPGRISQVALFESMISFFLSPQPGRLSPHTQAQAAKQKLVE